MNAKSPYLGDFRIVGVDYLKLKHWLAGDTVLIEPVSNQIPCKQGILQGISQNLALEEPPLCKKRVSGSDFLQHSLLNLSGKVCSQTGI